MRLKTSIITFALCACLPVIAVAEDEYPVIPKIDPMAVSSLRALLAWQGGFVGISEAALISKLGKPETTEDAGRNPVSKRAMKTFVYQLTELSSIRFTIHEGKVAAVAIILLP